MKNHVITITRQFGSLGRKIGQQVAKELGFSYYDRDLIEQAAAHMGMDVHALTAMDNHGIKGFARMAYPLGIGDRVIQKRLFEVQKKLILAYAETENCVIIGRCSDYILREHENVLSCYIYAPYLKRLDNCIDELGFTAPESRVILDEVDSGRSQYYKDYTGHSFNTTCFRDLLIDSSLMGIEGTADLITSIAKKKFAL